MTKEQLITLAARLMEQDGGNQVAPEQALEPSVAGIALYEAPILGFGAADDPLFLKLEKEGVVGPHFRGPRVWLDEAQTVISLFFPLTLEVRKGNRENLSWPAPGWIHARAEGMDMIERVNQGLRDALIRVGHQAVSPVRLEGFAAREDEAAQVYTSNWSERHVAYVCGLGTFGLSKGLITQKGVAGRLTSIITSLRLPPDERPYSDLYDYCSMCGACARNCPAGAITLDGGKDHVKCSQFVNETIANFLEEGAPPRRNRRYGCGKCQVKVPCEAKPCKFPGSKIEKRIE